MSKVGDKKDDVENACKVKFFNLILRRELFICFGALTMFRWPCSLLELLKIHFNYGKLTSVKLITKFRCNIILKFSRTSSMVQFIESNDNYKQ